MIEENEKITPAEKSKNAGERLVKQLTGIVARLINEGGVDPHVVAEALLIVAGRVTAGYLGKGDAVTLFRSHAEWLEELEEIEPPRLN